MRQESRKRALLFYRCGKQGRKSNLLLMKRIVVMGFMTACPIAGVIWQHIHYILGLKRLGYEPIYIEDSARYPYNPKTFEVGEKAIRQAVATTKQLGKRFGFRWAYRARFTHPMQTYGDFTDHQIAEMFARAEATFNLCGAQELHDEILKSRCLVYIESDPGVEQIKLDQQVTDTLSYLRSHHIHFTFGENIGQTDCPLPTGDIQWHATRQPIIIDLWNKRGMLGVGRKKPSLRFTTIANWETKGKDILWKDRVYYWSKTWEFLKFSDIPRCLGKERFKWEIATDMIKDPASKELFKRQGWQIASPHQLSCDLDVYKRYIQNSGAEWTPVKDQYLRLKTGWFSDRSACYLATGRPVVIQDTLFRKFIPTGEGLFVFRNMKEICAAAAAISANYTKHCRKAFEIAQEYFAAEKVLRKMLCKLGI